MGAQRSDMNKAFLTSVMIANVLLTLMACSAFMYAIVKTMRNEKFNLENRIMLGLAIV